MAEGNRKDPRARVLNMTVRYKSATVDEFIENHSHDISRGGIFIKTRAPFPAGTLLKFEVRIAEDQRLMQGVGRVVWRREPERAEDGFPAGMGIKFIKTGEGAAELIAQIVAARQGEESSFDAGARENAEAPPSNPGRVSGAPAPVQISEAPHPDAPALQLESEPAGMPVEGEIRVSSPPKKRSGAASETRKVVLQGVASEAPSSDKTPLSAPARAVAAQVAVSERAPNRPAPRGSLVDEITAPRARSSASGESARTTAQQQSNPSIYGLVAILAIVALTLVFVKLMRDPEPEPSATPPAVTSTPPAVAPEPSPPEVPAPSAAAAPAGETGEGAEPATAPAAPVPPASEVPAPPAAVAPPAAAVPKTPPATAATPAPNPAPAAAAAAAKPAPVAAAPAPAKPTAVAAKPPVAPPPPKPKVVAKPGASEEPTLSIRPAAPVAEPTSPGAVPSEPEPRPGEPAKKKPPTAVAPTEAEPAPKPAPAPSPKPAPGPGEDNPY